MKKLESKCAYCGTPNGQYEVYVIKKAYKQKGKSHRWHKIGYCCEECHEIHKRPIVIEYNPLENFFCECCNKKVSHKIVEFCMSPKGKFRIMCWDCQQKVL